MYALHSLFSLPYQMDEQQTFANPDLHPVASSVGQNLPEPTDQKLSSDVLPSAPMAPIVPPGQEPEVDTTPAQPAIPSQPIPNSNGSAPAPEKAELPPVVQKDEPSLSHQIQKDLKRKL